MAAFPVPLVKKPCQGARAFACLQEQNERAGVQGRVSRHLAPFAVLTPIFPALLTRLYYSDMWNIITLFFFFFFFFCLSFSWKDIKSSCPVEILAIVSVPMSHTVGHFWAF